MTLYLVGLGIYGEPVLTKNVYKIIRNAEKVYLELYTSPYRVDLKKLLEITGGREIGILRRKDVEEYSYRIFDEAEAGDIVILTPGDPLIATTHISLIIEAKKRGIDTRIYHASSALCTAIGESGLHTYKFGPSATIMRKSKASSKRAYDILIENMEHGLHTIFFLEYSSEEEYIMKPREAIEILLSYDIDGRIDEEQITIVLCGLGTQNECKRALTIKQLLSGKIMFPNEPCILIIPGKLHFTEKEYIETVLRRG